MTQYLGIGIGAGLFLYFTADAPAAVTLYIPFFKNVALPLALQGVGETDALARAAALLGEVGLGVRMDRLARELAHGEQRALEIAAAGGEEKVPELLRAHVGKEIGPIAKPKRVLIVPELPKTRSGKIMRRLLKDVAENREVGDATTLADSSVMKLIEESVAKS